MSTSISIGIINSSISISVISISRSISMINEPAHAAVRWHLARVDVAGAEHAVRAELQAPLLKIDIDRYR